MDDELSRLGHQMRAEVEAGVDVDAAWAGRTVGGVSGRPARSGPPRWTWMLAAAAVTIALVAAGVLVLVDQDDSLRTHDTVTTVVTVPAITDPVATTPPSTSPVPTHPGAVTDRAHRGAIHDDGGPAAGRTADDRRQLSRPTCAGDPGPVRVVHVRDRVGSRHPVVDRRARCRVRRRWHGSLVRPRRVDGDDADRRARTVLTGEWPGQRRLRTGARTGLAIRVPDGGDRAVGRGRRHRRGPVRADGHRHVGRAAALGARARSGRDRLPGAPGRREPAGIRRRGRRTTNLDGSSRCCRHDRPRPSRACR